MGLHQAHNGGMRQITRFLHWPVAFMLAMTMTLGAEVVTAYLLGQVAPQAASKPTSTTKPQPAADVANTSTSTSTSTASPKPIADSEARKLRELQLAVSETQNRLLQLERQFNAEQANLQTATGELGKYINGLQSKYQCPDYDLDQQLSWKKQPNQGEGKK